MRRILTLTLILLLAALAFLGWLILGPATSFSQKNKSLFVYTGKTDRNAVLQTLYSGAYIKHPRIFDWLAREMGVWDKLKPGRYELEEGQSLFSLAKDLKNGKQTPIKLVLNKVRTKEDLAGVLGRFFECDSTQAISLLNNPDSVAQYGLDTNTIMCILIPNTYQIYWNTPPNHILHVFYVEQQRFWTTERKLKAQSLGLTPTQVYILASIVEEETNKDADKPLIASTYLNRLAKGMRLSADPTVKFAERNFEAKRIYDKDTRYASPYNTYLNKGLPPGPICTPSIKTLDATLSAPQTDYLFFVAKADFSGYSTFTSDYASHMKNAKAYQTALDSLLAHKADKGDH
jgi:UPF0755 protein